MKVDEKLISELARLAKLNFDEKSSKDMQEDLNKIIEDIIKSGRIQKDDLTIVVVDSL